MNRPHHYIFGHLVLRQIFNENPHGFAAALMDNGHKILNELWEEVGSNLHESEGEEKLPADGLNVTVKNISHDCLSVIITLPKPEEIAEAHFVALIVGLGRKRLWGLLGKSKGISRYITLEHGMGLDENDTRTVLCEWNGDAHVNMGDGPDATIEAFANQLTKMV